MRAIVGAVLVDGTGGPPISNSVVIISGSRIAVAGARTGIVVPQAAEKIDGAGKFIVPGIVNIYGSRAERMVTTLARTGTLGPQATVEEAQRRVHEWAAGGWDAVVIAGAAAAAEEAALEQGRKDSIPVFARVSTLADARRLVAAGAGVLLGMIRDTEEMERGFLSRMRDLRTVWAPLLAEQSGPALEVARRNTKRLAEAGVQIAVATGSGSILREMELLQEAGLQPGDVLLAATRNGALALRKSEELGTIQAGRRADLVVVGRNPIEDVRNLRAVEQVIGNGDTMNWHP